MADAHSHAVCRIRCVRGKKEDYQKKEELCPLSLKDICTLDILPEIIDAGVISLKIEGRMKQPGYTAGVTGMYRKYLDILSRDREGYRVTEEDRRYHSGYLQQRRLLYGIL